MQKSKNIVKPKKNQDSSLVKTLQESNCLIIRPPHDHAKLKGVEVDIIKLIYCLLVSRYIVIKGSK